MILLRKILFFTLFSKQNNLVAGNKSNNSKPYYLILKNKVIRLE